MKIRNAVVHRDYSFTGKDVKVAIYDDMVKITSPGLLPPSIDYAAMESRQSDARNKVIAPVFKCLGIIDQWGNGLKLIADHLIKRTIPDNPNHPAQKFQLTERGAIAIAVAVVFSSGKRRRHDSSREAPR